MSASRPPGRHLGMQVSAYVDRTLDAQELRALDRHLVACQVCRYAADQERRLLTSLRRDPTPCLSEGLQTMLLGLASPAASAPPVPEAPASVRAMRLPTIAPAAPALHRSPVRAAMMAGLAAGATAAAAWSLTVSGVGPPGPSPARQPAARLPGATTATIAQSAVSYLNTGLVNPVSPRRTTARSAP